MDNDTGKVIATKREVTIGFSPQELAIMKEMERDPIQACSVCRIELLVCFHLYLKRLPFGGTEQQLAKIVVSKATWESVSNSAARGCFHCQVFCDIISSRTSGKVSARDILVFYLKDWISRDGPMTSVGPQGVAMVDITITQGDPFQEVDRFRMELCFGCSMLECTHFVNDLVDGPLSPRGLQKIKRWLKMCIEEHPIECSLDSRQGNGMPTRVLLISDDCASVRLKDTMDSREDYVALSHCWGPPQHHPPKTTALNYKSRLDGIGISSLSKTFQEAIKFTHSLGIRLIWIDSLCIIQNDQADWLNEADRMGMVYGNAVLVIAAAAAVHGSHGLFVPSWSHRVQMQVQDQPDSTIQALGYSQPSRCEYVFGDLKIDYSPYSIENPLYSRGWTLQERYLAKRVLHFCTQEIVFECRSKTFCGCGATKLQGSISAKHDFSSESNDKEHVHYVWQTTMSTYAVAALTHESDRLVAIRGLAEVFQKVTSGRILAGMWESSLPLSLLWYFVRESPAAPRACAALSRDRGVPSWSWASQSGTTNADRLSYLNWYHPRGKYAVWQDVTASVEVSQISPQPEQQDPWGAFAGGKVTIRGPVIASHRFRLDVWQEIGRVDMTLSRAGKWRLRPGQIMLLSSSAESKPANVEILIIAAGDTAAGGLILMQKEDLEQGSEQVSCYRRIGVALLSSGGQVIGENRHLNYWWMEHTIERTIEIV